MHDPYFLWGDSHEGVDDEGSAFDDDTAHDDADDGSDAVERRLNYFEPLLAMHPATDPFGLDREYPVPWYSLLTQVLAPLSLVYSSHALIDNSYCYGYRDGGHR
ncbi:hypothetical protein [Acidipropionibacterium timonense]|uniref:hypothetical protein n=1 Tax=Acidipropionibacterium timonense TaxID=2161818 RepID=UPI001030D8D0|nr:hypothetical protein [Acidipropionibacterium timonense]